MRGVSLKSIKTAIEVYYNNAEIGSGEIMQLFGCSPSTASIMKREVIDEMIKRKVVRFENHKVNTDIAYELWGLNIEDLEKRMLKLRKLGLEA